MHACGHDMHTTWLLGVAKVMIDNRDAWSGTLITLFQPGEETTKGAQAMIDDHLFERFPKPELIIGQHVAPPPAGVINYRPGPVMSADDSFDVRLFGQGGHGSMPDHCIDPVVMAAATIMRMQDIVSREISPTEQAVVTIGAVNAGTKWNVIPDEALLQVNVRSFDETTRTKIKEAIKRIADAE
jgi:hippurate hydrolase